MQPALPLAKVHRTPDNLFFRCVKLASPTRKPGEIGRK
jgi:hypothetical protein